MECACLFEIVSIARQFRQIEANATIKLINLNKFTLFDVIKSTILLTIYVLRLFISGWIHGIKFLSWHSPNRLAYAACVWLMTVQHFGKFFTNGKNKESVALHIIHINYVFLQWAQHIATGNTHTDLFHAMHIQIDFCQVIILIWLFDIRDN